MPKTATIAAKPVPPTFRSRWASTTSATFIMPAGEHDHAGAADEQAQHAVAADEAQPSRVLSTSESSDVLVALGSADEPDAGQEHRRGRRTARR